VLIASEKILPRRALKQPSPEICPGGDCGACSLGGVLGLSVSDLYAKFSCKGLTHGGEMDRCLRCALTYGMANRAWDFFVEPGGWHLKAFGSPAYLASLQWFRLVQMAIDGDYYGLAEVAHDRGGGPETNHWIAICGYRTNGAEGGGVITGEVLISCSVRGEEWMEARQFLKTMGGFATRFVRPA
jgi:hypothetical protein